MATTSSINPYSGYTGYSGVGKSSYLSLITGVSAAGSRNEDLFSAVKLLYQTTGQLKADQAAYRKQVRDFSASARSLNSGGFSLRYLTADTGADKALTTAKSTLGAYNNLTSTLGQASNVTPRATNLLSSLRNTMDSRSGDLSTIGITKDEKSGQWTVDDKKFTEAMTKTPQKVQSILGGVEGLGAQLSADIKPVFSAPVADYLKTPAATNNSPALKSLFSRGIFLDLMA